jgi:hypothetical protein
MGLVASSHLGRKLVAISNLARYIGWDIIKSKFKN